MKLTPLFTAKDKNLYKIEDNTCISLEGLKNIEIENISVLPGCSYFSLSIPWSKIELEPESYNEELLAELRTFLKKADETNAFAILIPVIDKKLDSEEDKENFINSYNHTARRLKDCVSIIGFELPLQILENNTAAQFMDTLAIKHAQYLYFVKKCNSEKAAGLTEYSVVEY